MEPFFACTEWNPWKMGNVPLKQNLKRSIVIRCNLREVCPSVSPFVLVVLLTPSFHVLRSYFYVSLSLVAVPTIWPLINFVTQFLNLEVDLTARWFRFCRLCYAISSCVLQAQWYTVVCIAFNLTQTCQTPRGKKCETLNQELEKVMRNG